MAQRKEINIRIYFYKKKIVKEVEWLAISDNKTSLDNKMKNNLR